MSRASASKPLLFLLLLVAAPALPQAIPTGSITGRVVGAADGLPLPGATVTVTSPNLQGVRTGVTSANGDYYVPSLPPGEYAVHVELSGFEPFQEPLFHLGASQSVTVNAGLRLKRVEASAVVIARSEQVSTGAADSTTYTSETMNRLPVGRDIRSAVALAPGVNQNGPYGAVTISGASSFENVYTVNGANTQDNVRGGPGLFFIEDAIQETTTTTSGISAEWGRFTGGVINTVTKSGGNNFSGSFRATLDNDTWRELSPYPADTYSHDGTLPTYEATLGGPFWRDHVWFFGAFRSFAYSWTDVTSPPTNIYFPRGASQTRWEGKATITPVQNQTLTGSYISVNSNSTGTYFGAYPILDLASTYDTGAPTNLWVINYNGVLSESLFLEGQYSQKHFTFLPGGSRYNDLINGTVLFSFSPFGAYNSPIFCAVCPDAGEERNNWDGFGKLNWFLSTKGLGSHNMALGFDIFQGSRRVNNWLSGSSFLVAGNSVIYRDGDLLPVFDEGTYLQYMPIFKVAQPSATKTISAFFNDVWKLSDHFSFNLGLRWDKNHAVDSSGALTANDSKWSPRLAAIWDPAGKGTFRVSASYAIYVAAPSEAQVGAGSAAGHPAYFYYDYDGPPINTAGPPYMTRAQALEAVFNWFGISQPNSFPTRPGLEPFFVGIPGVNQKISPDGIVSPSTTEWTVGVGGSLGRRFTYRVEGVYRNYTDFYTLYTNTSTGQITDTQYTGATYDLGLLGNGQDPMTRKYYGLHSNMQWRPWESLNIGGSWTWSHTYGNTVTEIPAGLMQVLLFNYPEYHDNTWYAPVGNLPQDQRHRVRLFGTWDIPFPKALGHLGLGFLYRLDTGLGYGAAGTVATQAYVTNPGYVTPPSSVAYWYTARDAFRLPTVSQLDLSLNYGINVGPVEIFVQPQVFNVFNQGVIVGNDTSVLNQAVETAVNRPSNYARFNPFTTVPVQGARNTGANWNYSPTFGSAVSPAAYAAPFWFRISMGVRF